MDPVSILTITNASFAIARSLVHTVKELYELAEAYETAALGIRTVATQCKSFRIAIERINKWLITQNETTKHDLDDDFWEALKSNLDTGTLILDDLQKRIQGFNKNAGKFWIRTKYLWNSVVISELQSQVQGLMAAVSLLVQVIDIPTTGGKRSQSLAQKQKLNGLTIRVRNRANREHRRLQEAQEQKVVNLAEFEQSLERDSRLDSSTANQYPLLTDDAAAMDWSERLQAAMQDESSLSHDTAPPPYEYGSTEVKWRPVTEKTESFSHTANIAAKQQTVPDIGFSVVEQQKSNESNEPPTEKKTKRPIWKTFMKKSSKKASPQTPSDPDGNFKTGATEPPATQAVVLNLKGNNRVEATPAEIDADTGQADYFDARQGTPHSNDIVQESSPKEGDNAASSHTADRGLVHEGCRTEIPVIKAVPEAAIKSNNPYRDMRVESWSRSEVTAESSTTLAIDFGNRRTDSMVGFDRIRPSQRVLNARTRSTSRGPASRAKTPPGEPLERQLTGLNRIGSNSFGASDGTQQTWQTKTISNRAMKFKIQFEKESFTNKMSFAAARALGIDDAVVEFAGVPSVNLTLLYTVSDGSSSADTAVAGDEEEFVVMGEHESRTPFLMLGAGLAHFATIAEESEYIYWNPRAVPEMLRTVDRLRLYRRFELVRW